jgi:large subunit ribosomal protein L13
MKTYMAKETDIDQKWYLIDAKDMVLGRLASKCASILRGKHKPEYTPHVDCGDFIVIVNADKIKVTGNKKTDKLYHRHTGYPGGLKSPSFEEVMEKKPAEPLRLAVKGMLPKGPLGRKMATKLKLFVGSEHKHAAQQPVNITDKIRKED